MATIGILIACLGFHLRLREKKAAFIAVELLGTAIAYSSKETAILLPIFCAAEVWVLSQRPPLNLKFARALLRAAFPQLVVAALYLTARSLWLPFVADNGGAEVALSLVTRLGMFLETVGRAVAITLVPWPLRGQHGLASVASNGQLEIALQYAALGAVTLLSALSFGVRAVRRNPALTVALLLTAGTFLPTSNLAPHRLQCLLFERYLFLPHLGCAWLFGLLCGAIKPATGFVRLGVALSFVLGIFVTYGYLFHQRALDYADSERFWTHELKHNPKSSAAPSALANSAGASTNPERDLRLLATCFKNANARRQFAEADPCLLRAIALIGNHTYDAERATLQAVTEEFQLLLQGRSDNVKRPTVHNRLGDFQLSLPPDRAKRMLESRPGLVEALLAVLHSRMGDGALASTYVASSLARCNDCNWTAQLATVLAAENDYPGAWRILGGVTERLGQDATQRIAERVAASEVAAKRASSSAGPLRIHARAEQLLALGRYGQAYLTLAPERDVFLPVREVALGFAQIACFAGYDAEARQALAGHLAPAEVTQTLAQWSRAHAMIR